MHFHFLAKGKTSDPPGHLLQQAHNGQLWGSTAALQALSEAVIWGGETCMSRHSGTNHVLFLELWEQTQGEVSLPTDVSSTHGKI